MILLQFICKSNMALMIYLLSREPYVLFGVHTNEQTSGKADKKKMLLKETGIEGSRAYHMVSNSLPCISTIGHHCKRKCIINYAHFHQFSSSYRSCTLRPLIPLTMHNTLAQGTIVDWMNDWMFICHVLIQSKIHVPRLH